MNIQGANIKRLLYYNMLWIHCIIYVIVHKNMKPNIIIRTYLKLQLASAIIIEKYTVEKLEGGIKASKFVNKVELMIIFRETHTF